MKYNTKLNGKKKLKINHLKNSKFELVCVCREHGQRHTANTNFAMCLHNGTRQTAAPAATLSGVTRRHARARPPGPHAPPRHHHTRPARPATPHPRSCRHATSSTGGPLLPCARSVAHGKARPLSWARSAAHGKKWKIPLSHFRPHALLTTHSHSHA